MLAWLNKKRAEALYRRACTHLDHDEPERAFALGEKLVRLKYTGGFEVLALVHQARGERHQAIDVLQRGVEVAPRAWLLWQLLGNLLDEENHPEDALKAYGQAQACPGVVVASVEYNRSLVLAHLQRHGEALEALERARQARPTEDLKGQLLRHRTDCLLRLGRGDEAVQVAQAELDALSRESDSRAQVLAEVAWAKLKGTGDKAGAKKAIDEVVELGGKGERWLEVLRHLDPKPLTKGAKYRLVLEGRWHEPAGKMLGFYVTMVVAAVDCDAAVRLAAKVLPASMRDWLHLDDSEEVSSAEPGTLEGVYWYPGGLTLWEESAVGER